MYEQLIKMFPLVADSNILSTIAEVKPLLISVCFVVAAVLAMLTCFVVVAH